MIKSNVVLNFNIEVHFHKRMTIDQQKLKKENG
jgi:hypothetical protein